MRIGIDVRPALVGTTGVGRYLLGLVPAVIAAGEQVTAFSASWKDRLEPGRFAGATIADRRIPVRALNLGWNRLGWPSFEALAGAADVVHSPTPLPIPTRRAARVVTVHDLFFLRRPDTVVREMRRDWVPLARAGVARADAVIAVSEWAAREAKELLDVDPRRLHVAHHGLEPRWFERPSAERSTATLARLGLREPFLLAVGSLEVRKNYPRLVAAFARARAAGRNALTLVIAGPDGPDGDAVRATVSRLGVAGAVRLLGWCGDDDLASLYARADALAMPSLDEGFGFPLLEAMALGCPVVASDAGALPEVAGDAALLVAAEDEEGLAEAVGRVIDDERLRERLQAAGAARARAFTWESSARRHIAAWRAAAEARA